jgi:hypothetical protein
VQERFCSSEEKFKIGFLKQKSNVVALPDSLTYLPKAWNVAVQIKNVTQNIVSARGSDDTYTTHLGRLAGFATLSGKRAVVGDVNDACHATMLIEWQDMCAVQLVTGRHRAPIVFDCAKQA